MVTKEISAEAGTKAAQLAKETELKLRLLVDGIRLDDSALEGVGTTFEERSLCVFDHRRLASKPHAKTPGACILPLGTPVGLKENRESPYVLKREDGHLVIKSGRKYLSEVTYASQPSFYAKKTSEGIEMRRIMSAEGRDMLEYIWSHVCHYDKFGGTCDFCNINWTQKQHRDEHVQPQKAFRQLKEAATEAIKDNRFTHIWMSGGMMPEETQMKAIVDIVRIFREVLGVDRLPIGMSMTAPTRPEILEELYREGVQAVAHNMEVWHPDYFRAICPGKNTIPGRDGWIQALKWAVEIFGKGNVRCMFVSGLEPMEYTLEGVEYMCSLGVAGVPDVWAPHEGSRYWRHRSPTLDWYMELYEKCVPLWFKYGIADPRNGWRPSPDPILCANCGGSQILVTEVSRRILLNNPDWVYPSLPPLNSLARNH